MMDNLELLPGTLQTENNPAEKHVWNLLTNILDGTEGFLGFRVLPLGNKIIRDTPSFTIVSKTYGVIFIDVVSDKIISIDEDDCWELENGAKIFSRDANVEFFSDEANKRLKKSTKLYNRKTKEFGFSIQSIIVFYSNTDEEIKNLDLDDYLSSHYVSSNDIERSLKEMILSFKGDELTEEYIDNIYSTLEGTNAYEVKRIFEKECKTVNDFIQKSLNITFKQDKTQRQISLQLPEGPQRIRGLAGTGKTVVLSLKSALTHFQYPDYKILYLFNTQSLYNQIERLISEYYIPEAQAVPNFNKLEILHAWGGRGKAGLYYNLCQKYGITPLTWSDVRGQSDGIEVIYNHLLRKIGDSLKEEYDLVLIDEAQDFPKALFEVIYKITKKPKRIVWAYDEFQSLKELKIRGPEELFGTGTDGTPNIKSDDLKGTYEGGIKKDFILANCYRNPRMTLMVAHAIALGLYSDRGLVDSIDSVSDWASLGYEVHEPQKSVIEENDHVVIERPSRHSQNKLETFLNDQKKSPRNLLKVNRFENEVEQLESVAAEIKRLISDEQVAPEEIIVVTLDTRNAENTLGLVRSLLNKVGVNAITPGFIEKSSAFKEEGFVTLTTPFRAKGNEGNVVFVVNCHKVYEDINFRGRNSFFVAVTRSRGWCHLYGSGNNMGLLVKEIDKIRADYPMFKFTRPDDETIHRRRVILSKDEKELKETTATIDRLLEEDREVLIEQLKLKGII
ncbi:DEAD/DEAH box helicase [Yersinia enterocolitica]